MNKEILLDSNVLIYLLNKEEGWINFLEKINPQKIHLSVVSVIEVLAGQKYHENTKEIQYFVREFSEIIPVGIDLSIKIGNKLHDQNKRFRDRNFADIIIGVTAEEYNLPLLTNNPKDFIGKFDIDVISLTR